MSEMSVYMNSDDHIILADADSGMAALVVGVNKVKDHELATIAGRPSVVLSCGVQYA
jgi:hypothetical protein